MQDRIYIIVFFVTFILIALASLKSALRMKTGADFSLANRSLSASGVSWVIVGTLIGGASTIGTVQMAYTHGACAWIFTLGSGIACLILGLFFSIPLREARVVTVSEYLGRYFGIRFRYYSSLITSAGMFVHIVAQFLASMAILQSIFGFGAATSVWITFFLHAIFVVLGGMTGAGLVGRMKFFLLYLMMVLCAGLAMSRAGGISGIFSGLSNDPDMFKILTSKPADGLMDMASMIVGVISTQIYLQAVFAARDVRAARNGALLGALIVPPIGALGVIVGLFLRNHDPHLSSQAAQALPYFINQFFSPAVAAFFSAALLIVVLGTGSGLVLGVTTNLFMDFLQKAQWFRNLGPDLVRIRLSCLSVLGLSTALVFSGLDSAILKWSYLSMGLRGSAVFAGLFLAVFFHSWKNLLRVKPVLYLIPPVYLGWMLLQRMQIP